MGMVLLKHLGREAKIVTAVPVNETWTIRIGKISLRQGTVHLTISKSGLTDSLTINGLLSLGSERTHSLPT